MNKTQNQKQQPSSLKMVWSYLLPILFGILCVVLVKFFLVQPVTVSGPSMYPNLENGQKVLAFKPAKIKRGSVIVFDANGVDPSVSQKKLYVKRVIGLPGDTVSFKNNKVYVNGKEIDQRYLSDEQKEGTRSQRQDAYSGKVTTYRKWDLNSLYSTAMKDKEWLNAPEDNKVPQGMYFVLGDNRPVSNDSRNIGFVGKSKILGVVKAPYWPLGNSNNAKRAYINKQWKYEDN